MGVGVRYPHSQKGSVRRRTGERFVGDGVNVDTDAWIHLTQAQIQDFISREQAGIRSEYAATKDKRISPTQ
jgi:hypothetical protein